MYGYTQNQKAFTLVEMLIVLVIVAIIGAVAIPQFIDMSTEAKTAVTQDRMQELKRAIVGDASVTAGGTYTFPGFAADLGRLPTALSELVSQGAMASYDPLLRTGWRGPYIDTSALANYAVDAWGTAFVYSSASRFIRSWGPNATNNAGAGDDITLSF